MAEEILTGTAPSVTPAPAAPTEPQAPQQPTPTPPQPSGGGKTVEQLAVELEEQAQLVRNANDRAARLEHEVQLARTVYENLTSGKVPAREPVAEEYRDPSDDEYLTSPVKTTKKVVYGALEEFQRRDREEREKEKTNVYLGNVRSSYEQGRQKAVQSNPTLFRGITDQVAEGILTSVKDGLKTGNFVDPGLISGEQYWELAAIAHRLSSGESMKSIMSKYYSSPTVPMTPGHTETPTAGGPPKAEVGLTPEQEELISRGHVTREQFLEARNKVKTTEMERAK